MHIYVHVDQLFEIPWTKTLQEPFGSVMKSSTLEFDQWFDVCSSVTPQLCVKFNNGRIPMHREVEESG